MSLRKAFAAAALLLMVNCAKPAPPPLPTTTGPDPAAPRVVFPDGHVVAVELALDDESRARGLMFRDRLAEGQGMLFIFPRDDVNSFWMKNTLIPLDMIFIDVNRRVVGISRDVPPCKADPCPSYGPGVPSRYVLEVAGGVTARHGLAPGAVLRFENLDRFLK